MNAIELQYNVLIFGDPIDLKVFYEVELIQSYEYNFIKAIEPGPYLYLLEGEYFNIFHASKNHKLTQLIAKQLFINSMAYCIRPSRDSTPKIEFKLDHLYIKDLKSLTLLHIRYKLGFFTQKYPNLTIRILYNYEVDFEVYSACSDIREWWHPGYHGRYFMDSYEGDYYDDYPEDELLE